MLRFNPRAFWSAALNVLLAYRHTDLCDAITPHPVDELSAMLEEPPAGRPPDPADVVLVSHFNFNGLTCLAVRSLSARGVDGLCTAGRCGERRRLLRLCWAGWLPPHRHTLRKARFQLPRHAQACCGLLLAQTL
jgi:hypothetical protein